MKFKVFLMIKAIITLVQQKIKERAIKVVSKNLPIDEEKPVQLEITSFGRSVEAFYLKSDVCAETVIQQLQKILF